MKSDSKEPKFNFRNTRSRLYQKKQSECQQKSNSSQNSQKQTGNYWKEKGNEVFKKGKIDQAINCYSKAIQLNPSESVYFSNRAKCFKEKKNYQKALKDAQQSCELNDENIKAHYLCGCILAQIGKKDISKLSKAENRLKKALRLCNTFKKTDFADQVSIKYYRLKKLNWFLERQRQIAILSQQIILFENLIAQKNKKVGEEEKYKEMIQLTKNRIAQYKRPIQISDHLCCKITLELMEEPVCTEAGFSYQRSAIEDHFKTNGFIEPISRKPITGKLNPNIALKAAVQDYLQKNPWAFEFTINEEYINIEF